VNTADPRGKRGERPASRGWDARSFAFDDCRHALSPEALEELSQGGAEGARTRSPLPRLSAEIEDAKTRCVDGWPGYVVITGLASLGRERYKDAFVAISTMAGDPYPQNSDGLKLREVRDIGTRIGEGARARYADSRHGGSLHTDGAEAPFPLPDYFSLLCVQRAMSGGAFQMVCARTLHDILLARAPDAVRVLKEPFHFDRRGDARPGAAPTTRKPVFFAEEGELCVTYLREYINLGHERAGVPLSRAQIEALDRFDDLLADPSLIVEGTLEPGSVVVVNNKRILHGRTLFEDGPSPSSKRMLLRMWLAARGERV